MRLINGPLIYLADTTGASLDGLNLAAAFAEAIQQPTNILVRVRGEPTDRVAASIRAVLTNETTPVQEVNIKTLIQTLDELAIDSGILALVPDRSGPFKRMFAGGVLLERLLHYGKRPILITPSKATVRPFQRVLFPADFSPRSEQFFDPLIRLCTKLNAELHLLHVFGGDHLQASEIDIERRSAATSPRELLKIDQETLGKLHDRATDAGIATLTKTAEGRAHSAILDYARDHNIDLIVMFSHGPRNTEDIFRGTTTIRVIERSPIPVLALHA